jgi:hypothetical protein
MKYFNKLTPLALALGFAAGAAQAVTINSGLVAGANNLIDESRETYVDANNDGKFGVGDVIFGYIRISDFQPSGNTANNQVYGVFSQQIAAGSAGRNVIFEATTVAGLRLKDLLGGDANVGTNALAAFYDRPTAYTDLINSEPPTAPTSMPGYLDYIRNNGALRLVAGFGDADDFLFSEVSLLAAGAGLFVGGSNTSILTARFADTMASNFGAFSILYEDTDWSFNEIGTFNPLTFTPADGGVLISSGTTSGASGADVLPVTHNWQDAGGSYRQCSTSTSPTSPDANCGFTNKNNFSVNAYKVPEPDSLGLFSAALLGLAGFARRRKS